MREERKAVLSRGAKGSIRPFLQPLTVAFVCMVFISLVLITGFMDLRTLDKTLTGYMEERGMAIIGNVRQVAQQYFRQLMQVPHAGPEEDTSSYPLTEDVFSIQESLIIHLVELAQGIDYEWKGDHPGNEQLTAFGNRESLWLLALIDEHGKVISGSRTVPDVLLKGATPVVRGEREIKISLFDAATERNGPAFIALRRKWGRGTIVLGLDSPGLQYMRLRVSVQRAIDEVGRVSDTPYFLVTDHKNRILGKAGEQLEDPDNLIVYEHHVGDEQAVTTRRLFTGKRNLLEISAPVRFPGGFSGVARLSLMADSAYGILKKERVRVFVSSAFLVVIAFLSMWFLYRNQNRHLARMQEMQQKLTQAERLSALGRLAAGVAHEIRNPLNAISMASQRLQKDNLPKLTSVIRDEIRRLNQIIEEFLDFSRSRTLELRPHDLVELVRQTALLMKEEAGPRGIVIRTRWEDSPVLISMDFDKLDQAFLNITKNAMEAIPDEGSITLSVEPKGKGWASVAISDTGTGLTEEDIGKIFDPDYTTKEKGLGLGLTLAHEIITGHGGEIRVRSRPGEGTTFEILLPVVRQTAAG